MRAPAVAGRQPEAHGPRTVDPTGSTKMGDSARNSVVDRHLRVHAIPNLRLPSTSVLPSGGGANPTMMLMLLAMRCIAQFEQSPAASHG
jgi:choline dehydrogenase-like flavoprotein